MAFFFFCYRPPDQSHETFYGNLSFFLSSVEHETNLIFLLGDFNAKQTAWDRKANTNSAGTFLYNMALDFSLTRCITEPTRFSSDGTSKSTIDLLLTNRPDLSCPRESCHFPNLRPLLRHCPDRGNSVKTGINKHPHYATRFNRATGVVCEVLCTEHHYLFQAIQVTNNVNVAWEVWQQFFLSIITQHIPTRTTNYFETPQQSLDDITVAPSVTKSIDHGQGKVQKSAEWV